MAGGMGSAIPGLLGDLSPQQQKQLQQMAFQQALLQGGAGLMSGGSFGQSLNKGVQQGLGAFNQSMMQAAQLNNQNQKLQTAREANQIARERNNKTRDENRVGKIRRLPSGAYVKEFFDEEGNVIDQQFEAGPPPAASGLGGLGGLLADGGGAVLPSSTDIMDRARQVESERKGAPAKAPAQISGQRPPGILENTRGAVTNAMESVFGLGGQKGPEVPQQKTAPRGRQGASQNAGARGQAALKEYNQIKGKASAEELEQFVSDNSRRIDPVLRARIMLEINKKKAAAQRKGIIGGR